MMKKLNDFLAGWPMTATAGVFLLLSFILPRTGCPGGEYLAWVCVVICGIPLAYLSVWRLIHNKGISKISSALLITAAMIAAVCIGDLFAAGEVGFIMELGALLEDMTTERAKKGLKNLIQLTPRTARRITAAGEETVPAEAVLPGDVIRILPGETVPVDGVILTGETSLDQSAMTGESLPVDKAPGDEVFSGTVNRFGAVDVRAARRGEDSSLQRLIRLVTEAEKDQAPTQRIADRWASWLVPAALAIALGAWAVTGDVVRAVTVMVVFCPCALVLATPTAVIAAIGQAAKQGVVIKSGAALERMGAVDTVAFDKTGTITRGELCLSDTLLFGGFSRAELLALSAAAESRSEHPLGKAILRSAREEGLPIPEITEFSMLSGRGVSASAQGRRILVGSEEHLTENGAAVPDEARAAAKDLREEGKVAVLTAVDGKTAGVLALSDTLRPEAEEIVRRLEAMKVKTVLLTGDNEKTAARMAAQAGISRVRAGLLPEDKVEAVRALGQAGTVCMIGDGVNDAPALKTADVGVAMGAMGSDVAVEAADVALMTDDLTRIPYLKWLSDAAVRTIRGAITLSMCINALAVSLSVAGVLTPTTGALVHNAGSCFVVLLAALLYDRKYKP